LLPSHARELLRARAVFAGLVHRAENGVYDLRIDKRSVGPELEGTIQFESVSHDDFHSMDAFLLSNSAG